MNNVPLPKNHQVSQRFGLIIWHESEDGTNAWMLFPKKGGRKVIGGLLENLGSVFFRQGWYKSVIDPEILYENALDALKDNVWDRYPFIIAQVEDHDILYMSVESEDVTDWSMIGVLEYGAPPKGKDFPIRWIRFSEPPPEVLVQLKGFRPASNLADTGVSETNLLQSIASWTGNIRNVTCHLSIDTDKEKYVLEIREGMKPLARKETEYTSEIVRFLREPLRTGEYSRVGDNTYLKWDHVTDVEYDEIEIIKGKKKESLHLSVLKPLVNRYSFYPDSFQIPPTAGDLLRTSLSNDITLKISIDERLKQAGSKKYLKVSIAGIPSSSHLSTLEQEGFGIFDVALLAECMQLVDLKFLKRHNFELSVEDLRDFRIPPALEEYSQLYDAIISQQEFYSDQEYVEEADEDYTEDIEKIGPPLMPTGIAVEESTTSRKLSVVVQLVSVEDQDFKEEMDVFTISSEMAKSQGIPYTALQSEIQANLRTKRITEDVLEEIISKASCSLEERGITIVDY